MCLPPERIAPTDQRDPLTNLISIGSEAEVKSMLVRLIDFLKMKQITTLFTSLTSGGADEVTSEIGVSSLMDTWILVRNLERDGERNRGLYVLKARGMAHSAQVREFRLSDSGIDLVDVYIGRSGVLTGSARLAEEAREQAAVFERQAENERRKRELERKRIVIQNQIGSLQAEIEAAEDQLARDLAAAEDFQKRQVEERGAITRVRQGNGLAQGEE